MWLCSRRWVVPGLSVVIAQTTSTSPQDPDRIFADGDIPRIVGDGEDAAQLTRARIELKERPVARPDPILDHPDRALAERQAVRGGQHADGGHPLRPDDRIRLRIDA